MPAHAGQSLLLAGQDLLQDPYRYDLTELEGLDVLSEPSECLLEAQVEVAGRFGVDYSYFLVNGASVGLIAALLAAVKPGEKVLLPRNAHRSVLSGLILTGAQPVWFLPERLPEWGLWGGVNLENLAAQLHRHPDARAVCITSPTYEGIGSDVQALSALCRAQGVALIVDEAHGSLWPFTKQLPASACGFGCDAVIHSMHKSGGSLTQSALAHLPRGSRIAPDSFQQALNTLQTTSPSYLLMASLEASVAFLSSAQGQSRIQGLMDKTHALRRHLGETLQTFRLFQPAEESLGLWDPCKLYFRHFSLPGEEWGAYIESERQIAYESASPEGVLYLANLGLETEDFDAFRQVMQEEDQRFSTAGAVDGIDQAALGLTNPAVLILEMAMLPREAFFCTGERVSSTQALGRVAKETIVHCPPGIPVLFPGERIQEAHLAFLPEEGVLVIR